MRFFFAIAALCLVACRTTSSVDRLLADVWTKDQTVRHTMLELTRAVTVEGRTDWVDLLLVTSAEQERIDAENLAVVESLLCEGLPEGLSGASYKTIWLVIDHAPLEKQEQYLPLVEQMAIKGFIEADTWAILCDRVAMGQNRPQRYGSQSVQFGSPEAMQLYLWPVAAPEKLDSLRATVGMSPIADYLKMLTETVGITAHFDPLMTVDELNRLRATE